MSVPAMIFIAPLAANCTAQTDGRPPVKASVTALWGTKALDNVVDVDLSFDVQTEKAVLTRKGASSFPLSMISNIQYSYVQCQRYKCQSPWPGLKVCCGCGSHRK
jgi:hypothetical protein